MRKILSHLMVVSVWTYSALHVWACLANGSREVKSKGRVHHTLTACLYSIEHAMHTGKLNSETCNILTIDQLNCDKN